MVMTTKIKTKKTSRSSARKKIKSKTARPKIKVRTKSAKVTLKKIKPRVERPIPIIKPPQPKTLEQIITQTPDYAGEVAAAEATKFDIGVTHNGGAMPVQDIPYEYGRDRAVILIVDPRFVFTYWEIRGDSLEEARRRIGWDAKLTLRFYDITQGNAPEQSHHWDVEVFERLGNWYLRLANPNQLICLDVGLKNSAGHFRCIARSNVMRLPSQSLAKPGPIKWMVVTPAGDRLISDIEEYTDADLALLKKILGPFFFDLLMRGRLASIAGSSLEAVFYDISLLRGGEIGESPSGSSLWSGSGARP